ncbi:MAG: patatin-like phospholipase family protein, partial [Nitrospinaceae bacterium]
MRLGLGLSGGGFRASFYHLGVLAQMADRDLLRKVEVISTVSGGSIIGALYYVYLKKRLEEKFDRTAQGQKPGEVISQQDYIDLVKDMSEHFRKAVQKNIRLKTFSNVRANWKMRRRNYSRSDRIAELYDELLYSPALGLPEGERAKMSDLYIQPKGTTNNSFDPDSDNENRQDKVPILLLNGTCLNSGHNWRFEAKTMGEPESVVPAGIAKDVWKEVWADKIDKNFKLERPDYHSNITPKRKPIKLGSAVAASATVPGLFPPLSISNMYHPNDFRIQVVDGGVHDNQGILGLEARKCDHFIISDASGQMRDDESPSPSALSVLFRTNGIMMDRIREEQLFRIIQRVDRKKIAYMSLRQGLPRKIIPYVNQDNEPNGYKENKPDGNLKHWPDFESGQTGSDVDYHVQDLLSHVRTDLDTFTDIEAFSLMANGYVISEKEFAGKPPFNSPPSMDPVPPGLSSDPRFEKCASWLKEPDEHWKEHMEVAGETVFKVFRLVTGLWIPFVALLVASLYWA